MSAALDLQLEPFNYHLNGFLYERSPSGISSRFHQAPYGVFKTQDGWLTMSISSGSALAEAFDDPRFAPMTRDDQFEQRETVNAMVAEHMVKKTIAEWEAIFGRLGMWSARVRLYDEVAADPQIAFNETIMECDDPTAGKVRLLSHPVRYNGKAPELSRTPPAQGEHTDEVLRELGYSSEQLRELQNKQAVGPAKDQH